NTSSFSLSGMAACFYFRQNLSRSKNTLHIPESVVKYRKKDLTFSRFYSKIIQVRMMKPERRHSMPRKKVENEKDIFKMAVRPDSARHCGGRRTVPQHDVRQCCGVRTN